MIPLLNNLSQYEEEKLCNLLECDKEELLKLYRQAEVLFNKNHSIYDIFLKILQQGYNVREATFIGLLCGNILGFMNAEEEMENAIKEKLFNAFKNNKPL